MSFVGGHLCNRIEILVSKSSHVHYIWSHLYNNASSTKVQDADLPSNMVWPLYTDNLQAVSFMAFYVLKLMICAFNVLFKYFSTDDITKDLVSFEISKWKDWLAFKINMPLFCIV